MVLFLDLLTLLALVFLSLLIYLFLFERGTFYRTSQAIHGLDDRERLRLLSAVLATPVTTADNVHLLREGPSLYEAQLEAIRSARHSIHLEVYLFYPGAVADSILAALCERAREGLQVRLIVDAIGSFRVRRHQFRALLEAGGRVYRYHPLRLQYLRRWNSRTHRNLLITDGKVAFIGGAGIADHWSRSDPPPWRDCVVRVTGEVVAQLQAVFAENWLECAGELLVGPDAFASPRDDTPNSQGRIGNALAVGSTPTAGGSTRARMLVQFLLAGANETIDLCTPYFIPDLGIRRELLAAKERGVRIRIVSGGPYGDHGIVRRAGRRRYGPLLEAGIEIREYAKHMLHAKALVVDGRWCLLGSTNIDPRSFTLNDEVNVLLWNAELAGQMREMFEEDLSRSELLSLARWRTRSWRERILASIGRLIERHQ